MIWNWTPLHISVRCQKTTSAVTPISILRQKQPPSKFVSILLEFWSECEGSGRKEEFPITNEIKLPPKTENIISLSLSPTLPFWKMVNLWLWHFYQRLFPVLVLISPQLNQQWFSQDIPSWSRVANDIGIRLLPTFVLYIIFSKFQGSPNPMLDISQVLEEIFSM